MHVDRCRLDESSTRRKANISEFLSPSRHVDLFGLPPQRAWRRRDSMTWIRPETSWPGFVPEQCVRQCP
jgi:hypothetical protein